MRKLSKRTKVFQDKVDAEKLYPLTEAIDLLKEVKVIIALGKIAFDACIQFYKENYVLKNKNYKFSHAIKYQLPDKKILIGCYHPSPRNINTKVITSSMINQLFRKAKKIANF